MNVLCGLYIPDHGTIALDGRPVQIFSPTAAIAAGIGMVHQHFKLVGSLNATQNIRLACGRVQGWRSNAEARKASEALSSEMGLSLDFERPVQSLPVAVQQRVEILRVLLSGARILILDEPTAVLTDSEAMSVLDLARCLARWGRAVILISHKLRDVYGYANRITVMRGGRTILAGVTPDVPAGTLVEAMIGKEPTRQTQRSRRAFGEKRLEVVSLSSPPAFGGVGLNHCTVTVRSGEMVGIAGVGGNGQSELIAALIGLSRYEGEILVDGQPLPGLPEGRRRIGLRFIPDDRFRYGLFAQLSVLDNLSLARTAVKKSPLGKAEVIRLIAKMQIAGAAPETPARLLSGGNAQKLMIAREFDDGLRVLVAHSPTRGLDVSAIAAIRGQLTAAAAEGAAILLVSEDLDEILDLSDTIQVISRGHLSTPVSVEAIDRTQVGRLMLGLEQ
jgi:general nucleoside transport system ATP-binding protein